MTLTLGQHGSKTDQLVRALLTRIRRGQAKPGTKLPSEVLLADHYGVSRVTVRRAVRELVRQGVIESRPGFGHLVRSRKLALSIGVLIGTAMFTPYQQQAIEALERQISDAGYRVRIYILRMSGQNSTKDTRPLIYDLRAGALAGILTVSWSANSDPQDVELKQVMDECGVPCVSLSSSQKTAAVTNDMFAFGHDGTRYLLDQGCRRIALVGRSNKDSSSIGRGWREAMAEKNVPVDDVLQPVFAGKGEAAGYEGFRQWWATNPRADAMLVPDDHMAKGVLGAAVVANLDLRKQLRVCSLWIKGSELFMPGPFIRFEIDPSEMAQQAMICLTDMMDDALAPPLIRIAGRITEDEPEQHEA